MAAINGYKYLNMYMATCWISFYPFVLERWVKWLWIQFGCWCQIGGSEYLKNNWFILLVFSDTTLSSVLENGQKKKKNSSEQQFCGHKSLVDKRGQRKIASPIQADREATVAQIISLYNRGIQKNIWIHMSNLETL